MRQVMQGSGQVSKGKTGVTQVKEEEAIYDSDGNGQVRGEGREE